LKNWWLAPTPASTWKWGRKPRFPISMGGGWGWLLAVTWTWIQSLLASRKDITINKK
jgi:hypothetical protein